MLERLPTFKSFCDIFPKHEKERTDVYVNTERSSSVRKSSYKALSPLSTLKLSGKPVPAKDEVARKRKSITVQVRSQIFI